MNTFTFTTFCSYHLCFCSTTWNFVIAFLLMSPRLCGYLQSPIRYIVCVNPLCRLPHWGSNSSPWVTYKVPPIPLQGWSRSIFMQWSSPWYPWSLWKHACLVYSGGDLTPPPKKKKESELVEVLSLSFRQQFWLSVFHGKIRSYSRCSFIGELIILQAYFFFFFFKYRPLIDNVLN